MLYLAEANESQRIVELEGDFSLSYDMMKYLQEHPSITLIYHVLYEGLDFVVEVSGDKIDINPEIPWYGPLWFNAYKNGSFARKGSRKYIVKKGDTLGAISKITGISVAKMVKNNGIKNPNLIYVNQIIFY